MLKSKPENAGRAKRPVPDNKYMTFQEKSLYHQIHPAFPPNFPSEIIRVVALFDDFAPLGLS